MIYIAGPMRGLPHSNYHSFRAAAERLRAVGHKVQNPAEIGERFGSIDELLSNDATLAACMKEELRILAECDSIYLLHGWQYSEGARAELKLAIEKGLDIFLEPDYP